MDIRRIEKIHKTTEIQLELDSTSVVVIIHPDNTIKIISPQKVLVKEQSAFNSVDIAIERRK